MKKIGDFFARFKNLTPPDGALKQTIADAASFVADVPVSKKDVTLAHGVAFIKTSSVAKSSLRTKRQEVLEYIFSRAPGAREKVRDIR